MRFGYCHWIVSPCKVRWLYQHEAPANGSIVDRPSRPIRILQTRKLRMEYPQLQRTWVPCSRYFRERVTNEKRHAYANDGVG